MATVASKIEERSEVAEHVKPEEDVCPLCKKPQNEEAMAPVNMQDATEPFDMIALLQNWFDEVFWPRKIRKWKARVVATEPLKSIKQAE